MHTVPAGESDDLLNSGPPAERTDGVADGGADACDLEAQPHDAADATSSAGRDEGVPRREKVDERASRETFRRRSSARRSARRSRSPARTTTRRA
jgi:hypothetical protein